MSRLRRFIAIFASLWLIAITGAAAENPSNKEATWILALTQARLTVKDETLVQACQVFVRQLASQLDRQRSRLRSQIEIQGYERTQRMLDRESSGTKIASALEKRNMLFFKGYAWWKYRKELASAEEALQKARADADRVSSTQYELAQRLKLQLSAAALKGEFPAAPEPGMERAWALSGKHDAVLILDVSPWYDRLRMRVQIFSAYLDEPLYVDTFAFSLSDLEAAVDETALRLLSAISGTELASLRFSVIGQDVEIFLDDDLIPAEKLKSLIVPAGSVEVLAQAAGHDEIRERLELAPGEKATLRITMRPLPTSRVTLQMYDQNGAPLDGSEVWLGSRFQGVTPLTLNLPTGVAQDLRLSAPDGRTATALVSPRGDMDVKVRLDELSFRDAAVIEQARKKFYGALGRFSIALPMVILSQGIALSYENTQGVSLDIEASIANIASYAAFGITAVFFVETLIRFRSYLKVADSQAIQRLEPEKPAPLLAPAGEEAAGSDDTSERN